MIRQTSMRAYIHINETGKAATVREAILEFLKCHPRGLTRNQISERMDIRINSVCGRVNELIKEKEVFEKGSRMDKSGMENKLLFARFYHQITRTPVR